MTTSDFKKEFQAFGGKVSPLGLGCMGMSMLYGTTNDKESYEVLEKAVEEGCTFWDTADIYGHGENERLLSAVLKKHRKKIFLCTKFGVERILPNGQSNVRGDPEYVHKAFNASLERLGVDYVDLYYQHRVDPKTPIIDTVAAMAELVKKGKVRYLGLSECSASTLRQAHAVHPISAVQMEYSPWTTDIERNDLLKTARELGVAIVCYSPLGRGFLTGAIKSRDDLEEGDFRRNNPRFSEENFPKNLELVKKITELAKQKDVTASQLTLAWVLAQGDDFIVIPGTKRVKYLKDNLGARDVKLTEGDIANIRRVVESAEIHGERYAPSALAHLDKST